jgi:hypothetical protein
MATADAKLEAFGTELVTALAKANGHPDPDGYAASVVAHLKGEAPAAAEPVPSDPATDAETTNG